MSNTLPAGVVPTLRQTKIKGKPIGSYYIVLNGEKIKLETKDYFLARERAKDCVEKGTKSFPPRDRNPLPMLTAVPGVSPGKLSSGKSDTPSDWVADLHAATTGAEPPITVDDIPDRNSDASDVRTGFDGSGIKPDGYYPPNATLPPIEPPTEANNPGDAPRPEDFTNLPPDMLEGMLETAAEMIVQLQLDGQAWLIRKMAKREPFQLPPENGTRKGAVDIWKGYLRTAVPTNVPLPPYLVAPLLLMAFGATEQLAKSSPLSDKPARGFSVVP